MGRMNMVLKMVGFFIFAMAFMIIATEATTYTVVFNMTGNQMVRSKADYDNCTKVVSGFVGKEGVSVLQQTIVTSGSLYFICPIDDDCVKGQKFCINVESTNSGASALQPHHSAITQSIGIFVALAVYFLTNAC
ncbi:unnamed protein product [Lupinus luteus]|uniref:Uncharacterized protein n=1 Tax=Lupinus luteus TaxID=3873 RepID=A0AAV1W6A2_LUPLU